MPNHQADTGTGPWRNVSLRRASRLCADVIQKSHEDRVTGLAAESAFFAVLSLFPALMILAATLGWLDRLAGGAIARQSETAVLTLLGSVLTDHAGGVLHTVRSLFERGRGGVLTSAVLFGAWSMSRGFATIIAALDQAYGLREGRSWINLRLTAILLSVGTAVVSAFILSAAVTGPLLGYGKTLAIALGVEQSTAMMRHYLRLPIAFACGILWLATLYHLAPNRRAPWKRDLPGALLAGVLWLLVSFGFSFYLRAAAGMNQIFGFLGGGLSLMIWVYFLCLALLVGGELNAVLLERAGIERRPKKRRGGRRSLAAR